MNIPTTLPDLEADLDLIATLKGGITKDEARFLACLAWSAPDGRIVETGSFQGKSALSLRLGARSRSDKTRPLVTCVEPHAEFIGAYGGRFGPHDREAFVTNLLKHRAAHDIALVNLPSSAVGAIWAEQVALLFIDGDHSESAVRKDASTWLPHVVAGGLVVFDDALDPAIGPYRVMEDLLRSGEYQRIAEVGKIIALRKLPKALLPAATSGRLRILIATVEIYYSGGMLRFERAARHLSQSGHELAFCTTSGKVSPQWRGEAPVLMLEEASAASWDAVVIPGRAGFDQSDAHLGLLEHFRSANFGRRVQFILNDKTYKDEFIAVNRALDPHLVLFNNRCWQVSDFPTFLGGQFRYLVGGVDFSRFSDIPVSTPRPNGICWIGGQTRKNAESLLTALQHLPENFRMRLFGGFHPSLPERYRHLIDRGRLELTGELSENQLPDYYRSVDLVVTPELAAGWSNTAAEAMAAGRPVICTPAGTEEFARQGETAIVVPDADPATLAAAVRSLHADVQLWQRLATQGRTLISRYDWKAFSDEFVALLKTPIDAHYFHAPEAGLFGKWTLDRRLAGLDGLLARCKNKTLLDVGAAEGLIAEACLAAGASLVHGVERDQARVSLALQRNTDNTQRARFFVADLNEQSSLERIGELRADYDVVLYLGVHHHLDPASSSDAFEAVLRRARERLFIRTSEEAADRDKLLERARARGFELVSTIAIEEDHHIGTLWELSRESASPEERVRAMTPQFISYPKSGRTWIRHILFKLGIEDKIQFHHDGFEFNDGSRPSHDFDTIERRRRYANSGPIILLRRDPRAVMVSLYHQVTGRFADFFHYGGELSDFIRDPYFGAAVLARFRAMWDELSSLSNVEVVDYEDCHADAVEVMERILFHIGYSFDRLAIEQAVAESTRDKMRSIEEADSFPQPWLRKRNGHGKVRKGTADGYLDELSPGDLDYLNSVFLPIAPVKRRTLPVGSLEPTIVLGMHRSGTSAIAGTLSHLKLFAGDCLQEGDRHNPKGYFEDKRIVAAHDRLLSALGSSWDAMLPLPEGWLDSHPAAICMDELREVVEEAKHTHPHWLLKDPRMCRLLPLWLRLFEACGVRPRFVLPIRHPDASVHSLTRRDALDPDHAYLLWVLHVLDAERATRGFRRAFLHYESFLSDWQGEFRRIDRQLDLDLDWTPENLASVEAFIDPGLDHRDSGPALGESEAAALARRCHALLANSVPAFDPGGLLDEEYRRVSRLRYSLAGRGLAVQKIAGAEKATGEEAGRQTEPPAFGKSDETAVADIQLNADREAHIEAMQAITAGQVGDGTARLIALAQADTPVWEVYNDLAAIAIQQADKEAAEDLLRAAVAKAGAATRANLNLAALEAARDDHEGALATLSPLLRSEPDNADALAMARDILGAAPTLSPIAWARFVTDLRIGAPTLHVPGAGESPARPH